MTELRPEAFVARAMASGYTVVTWAAHTDRIININKNAGKIGRVVYQAEEFRARRLFKDVPQTIDEKPCTEAVFAWSDAGSQGRMISVSLWHVEEGFFNTVLNWPGGPSSSGS